MMNICRRRLVRTWDRLLSRSIATEKKRRPLDERSGWEAVIGLEIHAQIASRSKLFSGAATDFDCSVNSAVSLFDCASPGTLPVLNRRCVEAAVAAALALNCRLRTVSSFDRKHYFYADMPAGYQITQQRSPIAVDGHLDFFAYSADEAPVAKRLRIERIQIEMDSGKTVHDLANRRSLVDLNRAGVGLIEIVTDHQLHTGLEAACFAEELRQVLVHIGVCGGEMQKGQLRVDANVSVRRVGEALGVRTEVKNLNSFKFIETAVKYEIDRQYRLLSEGGQVVNETRGYDDEGRTVSMRDKEVRQDYRFMPEPNLPPLRLSDGPSDDPNVVSISSIKKTLPAALADKRRWYIEKIGMDPLVAIYTVNDTARMKFVDDCFADKACPPIESMAFWLDEYRLALRKHKMDFSTEALPPKYLVQLATLEHSKRITRPTAKWVMKRILTEGETLSPLEIVEQKTLWRISDPSEIAKLAETAVKSNAKTIQLALEGRPKHLQKLRNALLELSDARIDIEETVKAIQVELQKYKK